MGELTARSINDQIDHYPSHSFKTSYFFNPPLFPGNFHQHPHVSPVSVIQWPYHILVVRNINVKSLSFLNNCA